MTLSRLRAALLGALLLPVLTACPSRTIPVGEEYRSADQVVRVTSPSEVEIRERGRMVRGRYEFGRGRIRITTEAGKAVSLRLGPDGLEAEGGIVLLSKAARRERSAALRKELTESLVNVAGGSFTLGSLANAPEERPPHRVTLSPFRLAKFEVTQGLWEAVMAANPSSHTGNPRLPVENVSWDECQEFIRVLNSLEGARAWRLPTEAEWEYAARAGTTADFPCGETEKELAACAWFGKNAGAETHPVGGLRANAWGLHDMTGNVWEWCSDWHGGYSPFDLHDPAGPGAGSLRVRRGGGFENDKGACRLGRRDGGTPSAKNPDLGLRLVRVGG